MHAQHVNMCLLLLRPRPWSLYCAVCADVACAHPSVHCRLSSQLREHKPQAPSTHSAGGQARQHARNQRSQAPAEGAHTPGRRHLRVRTKNEGVYIAPSLCHVCRPEICLLVAHVGFQAAGYRLFKTGKQHGHEALFTCVCSVTLSCIMFRPMVWH
jgi:hypothetical protein